MWSLLLLAAIVRSFPHMPLGISDRNTTKLCCKKQCSWKKEKKANKQIVVSERRSGPRFSGIASKTRGPPKTSKQSRIIVVNGSNPTRTERSFAEWAFLFQHIYVAWGRCWSTWWVHIFRDLLSEKRKLGAKNGARGQALTARSLNLLPVLLESADSVSYAQPKFFTEPKIMLHYFFRALNNNLIFDLSKLKFSSKLLQWKRWNPNCIVNDCLAPLATLYV